MNRAILLALLALSACGKTLPPGVERVTSGTDDQTFFWSAASRRLAYVEGRFPGRTHLVVVGPSPSARRRHRFKGYVLGGGVALARDGRRALLEVGKVGTYASRSEPVDRVVLLVDVDSGRILSEDASGRGGLVALGHPAWSADPIAVSNDKDGLAWQALGRRKSAGLLPGDRAIARGSAAWRGLLLDEPYLVAAEKQTQRPRLTVYDLKNGREVREWRVALTAAPLALRPDGTALIARWVSESGRFVLEACDPKTGRREVLLESEGEIETAIETREGLYAVAKDHSRPNSSGREWLAPRVLLVIESGGLRWSTPWTAHKGVFLGFDPTVGRLWYAVTDKNKPGAWKVAPTRAALTAAGTAIDGKTR